MRLFAIILLFLPGLARAETVVLPSPVTSVVVYPEGATITRKVPFSVPAGSHDLILPDLPVSTPLEYVRVKVEGAKMGVLTLRNNYVPPRQAQQSSDITEAKARIERIERRMDTIRDSAAKARLAAQAAEIRLGFLRQLGSNENMANAGSDTLRDISRMIGQEALAARQTAFQAEQDAVRIERALEDEAAALKAAQAALDALVPEADARAFLSVAITTDAPAEGMMTVSYFTGQATWVPVYDMYLSQGDAASIEVSRGAFVSQNTGENWRDVALTLSTVQPARQLEPSYIHTQQRRIEDPALLRRPRAESLSGVAPEPAMEAPVILEEDQAVAAYDGPGVTYAYPSTTNIASDADAVRFKLGTLTIAAKVVARAVPSRDDTAFLVAEITNTSDEPLLPTYSSSRYVDGAYVGTLESEAVPVNATAELAFGPIEGLRLKRFTLDQSEGDRGIISKSNQRVETDVIEVRNLTGKSWAVRVLDSVPYSEQEDLQILWSATPMPTAVDVDDRRGILGWDLTLAPNAVQSIELQTTMTWPDGKVLR